MENGTTIKEYIKEYYEQLSAMGALGGLAALVGELTVSWIGYLLSFLMLSCLVLIWSEIEMGPNKRSSIRLGFFKFFLKGSFWLIVLYLLVTHRTVSWFFLFVPLFLFFMITSIGTIRRHRIFTSFFEKHKVAWGAVVITLVLVSFLIGFYLSIPANIALDSIAQFNTK